MKIGSASFRNCTRTEMAKSCPTFSSGDILRRDLSAHFLPDLSRWMERSCADLSLLLSLFLSLSLSFAGQNVAEQRVARSAKAISECRGMQLTIAKMRTKMRRDVVPSLLRTCKWSRDRFSNERFDGFNGFRLNG